MDQSTYEVENQQLRNSNEAQPEKKKKSAVRKIITVLVLVLIVTPIVMAAFLYFYIGNSSAKIKVDVEENLDTEYYFIDLVEEGFDGNTFEAELEEGVINYLLAEQSDSFEEIELPLGIKVTNVLFDARENSIFAFLEGSNVDTYVQVVFDLDEDDDLLKLEVEEILLGKWQISLPKNLILSNAGLPDEFFEGFEVPKMITLDNIDIKKDAIELELELDQEYLRDRLADISDGFDHDKANQYYQKANEKYRAFMDELWYVTFDGGYHERFIEDMIDNSNYAFLTFALMYEDDAKGLLNKLQRDIDYLPETFVEDYMAEREIIIKKFEKQ